MSDPVYQVWFMPWADLREEVQIGRTAFWPFREYARRYIVDGEMRRHLRRYFRCYVDHWRRPVSSIAICTLGKCNLRQLSDREAEELRSARDALVFAQIAPQVKTSVCAYGGQQMGPPSSECYELICQNFRPGDNSLCVRAGSRITGGLEIGKVAFAQPFDLGGHRGVPDNDLLSALGTLSTARGQAKLRQRVFRSMEWFALAHTEAWNVSVSSRLVMMCTAFESLLRLGTGAKKEPLADKLDDLCMTPKIRTSMRTLRDKRTQHKAVTHSDLAWWSYDFYEVRNKIVHGDRLDLQALLYPSADPGSSLSHLIVADLVYWECVVRLLFQNGLIRNDIRDLALKWHEAYPAWGDVEATVRRFVSGSLGFGFDAVHKALGWADDSEAKDASEDSEVSSVI